MSSIQQRGQSGLDRKSGRVRSVGVIVGAWMIALLSAGAVSASDADSVNKAEEAADNLPMPPTTPIVLSPAEQYCSSVLDAASAAQLARQKGELAKAQQEVENKIALLTAKTHELKHWMKKREDFSAQVTDSLVQIYAKMDPDAAGAQLAAMDEFVAAAIMSKLPVKAASLIMAEMEAAKAARLSAVLASAADLALKPERRADGQH
jgi:flagellar motility protein MotE (MotC chaperone)